MISRALNPDRLAQLRLRVEIPRNLPPLILEAIEACALIVTDPDRFPELGGPGSRFRFSESMRRRDLRRREGIALALMSILYHWDLVTARSGKTRADGSCDSIRVARPRARAGRALWDFRGSTIETETGLGRSALCEALRDLRDAAYATSSQPKRDYVTDEGEVRWRSFPAIYVLTPLLFERLGITEEKLKAARDEASQKRPAPKPEFAGEDVRIRRLRQRMIRDQRRIKNRSRGLAAPGLDRSREGRKRAELELELMRRRE